MFDNFGKEFMQNSGKHLAHFGEWYSKVDKRPYAPGPRGDRHESRASGYADYRVGSAGDVHFHLCVLPSLCPLASLHEVHMPSLCPLASWREWNADVCITHAHVDRKARLHYFVKSNSKLVSNSVSKATEKATNRGKVIVLYVEIPSKQRTHWSAGVTTLPPKQV